MNKLIEFESFRPFLEYEQLSYTCNNPSVGNGKVHYRKYRYVIEEIVEPVEVLGERLQDLWDHITNYHHVDPIREEARRIGYTLTGSYGSKVWR